MSCDFKVESSGGAVMLYPETERAATYTDTCLIDEDHQEDEWSGGIPFGRQHAMTLIDELNELGFSTEVNL